MKKILIIEDDLDICENLESLLESEHFEVFTADTGRKGVDLAKKINPDLILCDMKLPELDGLSVLKLLKTSSLTIKIPFIFISGISDRQTVLAGLERGAANYVVKPFEFDKLLEIIKSNIK